MPRPLSSDQSLQRKTYGPIRPMDEKPSLLRRLFEWVSRR
jgi:hypothetical protein